MLEITLPFSADGFYRFGDLPWLIGKSLVPDDPSAKDWIRCVTSWITAEGTEGTFLRRIAPDGVLTDELDACNSWPAVQIDLSEEPKDRSNSKIFNWLWHEQRRSPEWHRHLGDGSLVICIDTEPRGRERDFTRGSHQLNYEKALQKAAFNKEITVCDASGLPQNHVHAGQALKDAVVHIDELNRWGGTLSGGQQFVMQEGMETGAPSDALGIDFTIPLMPTEVPSELLKLPLDAMITYSTGMSVGHTGGRTSIGGLIELIRERIDIRAKGRYSLKDAARLLEVEAGEDGRQMLEALIDDAVEGEFAVHQPGKNATFNATKVARSSAWRLEAVSGTLNRWLEIKHPLIRFRFQDPPLVEPSCSARPAGVLLGLGADEAPVCEGNERQRPAEGGESKNGMTRRWTPEFTAEVQAYRHQHGTTAAANHFKVSTTVIKSKTKAKRAAHGTPANPAFSILTTGFIDRRR